ncbi:MAG: hypothetical protein ACYSVY_06585, partial [Planctomycetota bacterium]
MFSRLYHIAANTFLETIRQPIYGVVLLATALLMILNIALAGFTLEDDDKLLLDLGLSTLLLSGLFLSVFSATGVLTREIENKTVLTVGVLGALVVALYLCFLVFLLTMRHRVLQTSSDPWDGPVIAFGFGGLALALGIAAFCNYFYGSEFASTSLALAVPLLTLAVLLTGFWDKTWNLQPYGKAILVPELFYAAFLVMLAVMVLAAVALAASTRLGQVMTLLVCVLIAMLGLVADFALGQHGEDSLVARTLYHVVPNLGFYSITEAINAGIPVPPTYIAMAT